MEPLSRDRDRQIAVVMAGEWRIINLQIKSMSAVTLEEGNGTLVDNPA